MYVRTYIQVRQKGVIKLLSPSAVFQEIKSYIKVHTHTVLHQSTHTYSPTSKYTHIQSYIKVHTHTALH
jgi:hypothetical protein